MLNLLGGVDRLVLLLEQKVLDLFEDGRELLLRVREDVRSLGAEGDVCGQVITFVSG